ncbi:hypothetical protein QOZ80_9BG0700290 [Eleusine coracana subsp. coracana]|nr:hypothetical protein QOZ80_9BG0700290 [Eleusine coracana subsp. coracana]
MPSPRARSTAIGADRLGVLPEGVIHHVLSLVPAHDAVRTCVVARRWRHLWTSAPRILVTGDGWRDAERFLRLVDRLLSLRRGGAAVQSWEFRLDQSDFHPDFDFCYILFFRKWPATRWIERVLGCNVGTLRLSLNHVAAIGLLPDSPLVSQHLTRLELDNVDTDNSSSSVFDFSGCPLLLEMKMEKCYIDVDELSSASLKQLTMVECQFGPNKRTHFSLPSLVSLELNLSSGRAPLLGSMPSLETAIVSLGFQCADTCECEDDYCYDGSRCYKESDGTGCVLLKGLSEATHLQLSSWHRVFVWKRDLKRCPKLTNLKSVLLGDWCIDDDADLSPLICFLQNSLALVKLTLQLSGHVFPWMQLPSVQKEGSHNPLELLHASNSLKVIVIKCDEVDERVHKILKMMSASGIPLEHINIQQTNRSSGSGYLNFVCTGFIDS